MHILHVISELPKAAGTSVFCSELSDHLTLEGVDCSIVVQNRVPDEHLPAQKVPVYEGLSSLRDLPFLPDILHVHALWSPCLHQAVQWARKKKIKIVVSPHGMLTPWALGQKRLKRAVALAAYQYWDLRAAALFHATCESEVRDIRRLGLKQPVVVAPLGVEVPSQPPFLRAHSPRTALFVSRIHPKKGLFNLIDAWAQVKKSSFVHYCDSALVERPEDGGQRPEDGKEKLAFSLQPSTFLPWQLVIAGPDQDGHTAEIKAKAEKLGLSVADIPASQLLSQPANPLLSHPATQPPPPDIVFTGPVYDAEKDDLYRMADLFVLPTYSENFGVVVIEALAQGCPVITTKGAPWEELLGRGESELSAIGELSTISRGNAIGERGEMANTSKLNALGQLNPLPSAANGRCGWWINIGVEPLATSLREAMSLTDEQRRSMGENGRLLVETKYTWSAISWQMKIAYTQLNDLSTGCFRVQKT